MSQVRSGVATVRWGERERADSVAVTRLSDTGANRAQLKAQARRDRMPSVLVDLGADVALLSGAGLRPVSAIADPGTARIRNGSTVRVGGQSGKVFGTDDGFADIDASRVTVAVIDSGLNTDHVAFKGRIVKPFNAITGGTNVTDTLGHGSFVAGIAAGTGGHCWFADGVAQNARVMPIKVFGEKNLAEPKNIAKGIRYAVDHGAKVINMSLGADEATLKRLKLWDQMPALNAAVAYAVSKGVVVVVASGNAGRNDLKDWYPANTPGVIAVGAVGRLGRRAGFSNGGDRLDVVAPGVDILGPGKRGKESYQKGSGTSMAAPYVAGVAALVRAQHPDWTGAQVAEHIKRAVRDRGPAGKDIGYGRGEMDAFKAVFESRLPESPPPEPKKGLKEQVLSFFELH